MPIFSEGAGKIAGTLLEYRRIKQLKKSISDCIISNVAHSCNYFIYNYWVHIKKVYLIIIKVCFCIIIKKQI